MITKDQLFRFVIERTDVRGELVYLDSAWQELLANRPYPTILRQLLGQAMALLALLSTTIKTRASLTLQIQGKGPITLLVVQIDADHHIRGTAEWHGDLQQQASLTELFGSQNLTVTIEPEKGHEHYQSIIELDPLSLSASVEKYFRYSEQIETRLWLVTSEQRIAGILLQKLPAAATSQQQDADAFNRMCQLTETVTEQELLQLPQQQLLHRLYHEETVRLFPPQAIQFGCHCSKSRMASALYSMGKNEIDAILAEQGEILIECSFCNQTYRFDSIDCELLFTSHASGKPSEIKH